MTDLSKLKAFADNKLNITQNDVTCRKNRRKHGGKGVSVASLFTTPTFLLTHSQTSPGFYVSASTSLLKTLLEKEKLLVWSNFSFFLFHSVFYLFGDLSAIYDKLEIIIC